MSAGPRVVQRCLMAGRSVVKGLALVLLLVHFALTLVYVLPDNPVKAELLPLLNITIDVYAQQNWNLFAPNPISSDFVMLARCLDDAPPAAQMKESLADGKEWTDLSLPIWRAFQADRFSAYDRLIRPLTGTMRTYLNGGATLNRWRSACADKNDEDACKVYETGLQEAREAGGATLRRLGSGFCGAVSPASTAVALRARVQQAVPWSRRLEPGVTGKSEDVPLGVFAIERGVAGSGIYDVHGTR